MNQLIDPHGQRLYLTQNEREAFLTASEQLDPTDRTFCMVMHSTGCRISEALNLTADRLDYSAQTITFESLKKRQKGIFRAVPVPASLMEALDLVHNVRKAQRSPQKAKLKLWTMSRRTAYSRIKQAMALAGIEGAQASPKGLRHGYGVQAVACNVPLNILQKILGHSQMSTTAIYADAQGQELREIVSKMW